MDTQSNPYVGPRAFTPNEKNRFFGREREIRQLKSLLIAERLVMLHSPSGAGKTSLIHAGLLNAIEDDLFHVLPVVRVNTHPGDAKPANRYVYSAILSLEEGLSPEQRIPEPDLTTLKLDTYLKSRYRSPEAADNDLLIFDQFEEILTSDPIDEMGRQAFFEQLSSALANTNRWALFAIREDYLGALAPYTRCLPGHLGSTFRLGLLGIEAAIHAVQKPAGMAGVDFIRDAAEKLVKDLSYIQVQRPDGSMGKEPGLTVEPVQLQVVCYRIFEANRTDIGVKAKIIDESDLAAAGDVDKVLGDFYRDAVEKAARQSGVSERQVRDWFGSELVKNRIRMQVPKGTVTSGGLSNQAIQALVDAHIVRSENRSNIIWFELAHDRLIDPLLQNNETWRKDNFKPFQVKAAEWLKAEKPKELLLNGTDLAQARLDREAAKEARTLIALEEEYLKASETAWQQENLKPFQRQAQLWYVQNRPRSMLLLGAELAQAELDAKAVASLTEADTAFLESSRSAEQRQKREKRNQTIIRWLSAAAGVGMVLAIGLALLSLNFYGDAIDEGNAAKTAEAKAVVEGNLAKTAEANALDYGNKARAAEAYAVIAQQQTEQEAEKALSLRLAFQSQTLPLDQLDSFRLSGLLAVQSGKISRSPEVNQSLRRFLNSSIFPVASLPHGEAITTAAFSADGGLIVLGGLSGRIYIWRTFEEGQNEPIKIHDHAEVPSAVSQLIISREGSVLASMANESDYVLIHDVYTGERINRINHSEYVMAFDLSDDGEWVVVAGSEGIITVYATRTGRAVSSLRQDGMVNAVDFSPDGQWIVSGSVDGTARIWVPSSGLVTARLWHGETVSSVAFDSSSQFVVTGSENGAVQVWDLVGVKKASFSQNAYVRSAKFSPDGSLILSYGFDNTVHVWNRWDGTELARVSHVENVTSAHFNYSSQWVISSSDDNIVRVWEAQTGNEITRVTHGAGVKVTAVYSEGNYNLFASAGWEPSARVWIVEAINEVANMQYQDQIESVAFDQNSERIFTTFQQAEPDIFTYNSWESKVIAIHLDNPYPTPVAFNSDGSIVAAGYQDGIVRIFDTGNGDEINQISQEGAVTAIAFSQDGARVAIGGLNGAVRIWDLASDEIIDGMSHEWAVMAVAFDPSGKRLVSGSEDSTARVWDIETRREIYSLPHRLNVSAVATSSDGKWIVTGSYDRSVRVWDAASGEQVAQFNHDDYVEAVAFSSDSRRVISGSHDRTARIWDLTTFKEIERLQHVSTVSAVAFSHDDQRIATGTLSGGLLVWFSETPDLMMNVCKRVRRNLTPEEWKLFLGEQPYEETCPPEVFESLG